MKTSISIRLKAASLLILFSLNMVIGFACAIGIDMWFNISHHEEKEIVDHGSPSHHHDEIGIAAHESSSHHHDEADEHHKSKDNKDNCCNDQVIKFAQVEKFVPHSFAGPSALFFTTLISSFYNIDVLHTSRLSANIKYFVRHHHPPIPDIRIAIQSFQI